MKAQELPIQDPNCPTPNILAYLQGNNRSAGNSLQELVVNIDSKAGEIANPGWGLNSRPHVYIVSMSLTGLSLQPPIPSPTIEVFKFLLYKWQTRNTVNPE